MPFPAPRVTLRDIAEAAGVHFTTVSLALRNHPRLPRATCERIQRLAKDMGYVPDPMVASLASYRHAQTQAANRATLAWVTSFPRRYDWKKVDIFREQYEGAALRANALGYTLEDFWITDPGMSCARSSQILRTRNITGLIIAPQPKAGGELALDWDYFSAVSIGYSLVRPSLHMVCAHQYRCIRIALQELDLRGYRRIGLVMLKASDDRVDRNWLAGYLVDQYEAPRRKHRRPLMLPSWNEDAFADWFRREKPDAIVTKLPQTMPALRRLKVVVPDEVGLVYLSDVHPGDDHSGVDEKPRQVGAAAVDLVVGMLHRNERGIPATPNRLLIEGAWVEGATVRPRLPDQLNPPFWAKPLIETAYKQSSSTSRERHTASVHPTTGNAPLKGIIGSKVQVPRATTLTSLRTPPTFNLYPKSDHA